MVEKSHTSGFWPQLYDPFRQIGTRLAEWVAPASEAKGSDGSYTISIELPGVAEDDIQLTTEDGVITIKGEKKTQREEKGDTWFFSERQYGSFSRSFRLPPDADEAGIDAALKDGVLTVSVPKKEEKTAENKRISIRKA